MLDHWEGHYGATALKEEKTAAAEDDDILVGSIRLPMFRQQTGDYLCLADFIKPATMGSDTISFFATCTDADIPQLTADDPYERMLAQTLADRLAEAAAELTNNGSGMRFSPGYPSMPDMSINFLLDKVLDIGRIGIKLTENGMMIPHAAVTGMIIYHPKARYFDLRHVGDDQIADYAQRRGLTTDDVRRFLRA